MAIPVETHKKAAGQALLSRVEGYLTANSPFYAKKMQDRKEKVKEAEKARQNAHFQHLDYLSDYEKAHDHVKVGHQNRNRWMQLNEQKKVTDSEARRHTIAAHAMSHSLPAAVDPLQGRADHFQKVSSGLQAEMDHLAKKPHYEYELGQKHINAHVAREETHNRILKGYNDTIRKNSRPWPL